jgi:hypothetical protein
MTAKPGLSPPPPPPPPLFPLSFCFGYYVARVVLRSHPFSSVTSAKYPPNFTPNSLPTLALFLPTTLVFLLLFSCLALGGSANQHTTFPPVATS